MVEVTVHSVRVSPLTQNRVVVLMEMDGRRYLPIWIGADVADAIALQLRGEKPPRPLTHDLLRSVIEVLGAKVSRILVNEIHENTFFARIIFDVAGRYAEVDSRPSDAIALAVRVNCPIFVEDLVLQEAALVLDEPSPAERPVEPGLDIFRSFIEQLESGDTQEPTEEEEGLEEETT